MGINSAIRDASAGAKSCINVDITKVVMSTMGSDVLPIKYAIIRNARAIQETTRIFFLLIRSLKTPATLPKSTAGIPIAIKTRPMLVEECVNEYTRTVSAKFNALLANCEKI